METEIKRGIYRHYKGKDYLVLGLALDEATKEKLVVYRALYEDQEYGAHMMWVRPLAVFIEDVDLPEYNYKGPRFRLIKQLEN